MTVINPCDYNQTKAATIAAAEFDGPVYLRFGRPIVPVFTDENQKIEIGKVWMVNEGKDVTIIATGHLVWEAIKAGKLLDELGIDAEIINIHTIKVSVIDAAKGAGIGAHFYKTVEDARNIQLNIGIIEPTNEALYQNLYQDWYDTLMLHQVL